MESSCCTATTRAGGCRAGMTDGYVELHCHSAFSLLDGASLPEALVERAAELKYPALALTDHDELGGAVRFAQMGSELGVRAIIGAEISVEPRATPLGVGRMALEVGRARQAHDASLPTPHGGAHHLVLLAETREGYGNLSTLITKARMQRARGEPSVDLDTIAQHAKGLFALTGCPRGWVPALAAAGD